MYNNIGFEFEYLRSHIQGLFVLLRCLNLQWEQYCYFLAAPKCASGMAVIFDDCTKIDKKKWGESKRSHAEWEANCGTPHLVWVEVLGFTELGVSLKHIQQGWNLFLRKICFITRNAKFWPALKPAVLPIVWLSLDCHIYFSELSYIHEWEHCETSVSLFELFGFISRHFCLTVYCFFYFTPFHSYKHHIATWLHSST